MNDNVKFLTAIGVYTCVWVYVNIKHSQTETHESVKQMKRYTSQYVSLVPLKEDNHLTKQIVDIVVDNLSKNSDGSIESIVNKIESIINKNNKQQPREEARPHIVFTTFKCPECDSLRMAIENNTQRTWSSFPKVTFESLSDNSANVYGVPILGAMYTRMIAKYPNALTYTYINGDILGRGDFVDTIEVVLPIGDFLMVGKRTNVAWSEKYAKFDFDELFKNGVLFQSNAQDYFTVTKRAFDWDAIPPFVVGRPAYDNWLVDHVYHKPNVSLVDATKTVSIIHQTDGDGILSQGGKMVKSEADREYNRRVGKGQWDHGHMYHAEWETDRVCGKIVLKKKNQIKRRKSKSMKNQIKRRKSKSMKNQRKRRKSKSMKNQRKRRNSKSMKNQFKRRNSKSMKNQRKKSYNKHRSMYRRKL